MSKPRCRKCGRPMRKQSSEKIETGLYWIPKLPVYSCPKCGIEKFEHTGKL